MGINHKNTKRNELKTKNNRKNKPGRQFYALRPNKGTWKIYAKSKFSIFSILQKNKKRCGMVFRNRYKAEPIYNTKHLINCIQYIHMNPVKARIVDRCEEYKYSSYKEYMKNGKITKSKIMTEVFGSDCEFEKLFDKQQEQIFIDIDSPDDSEIRAYIDFAINEFLINNKLKIADILSDRNILKSVVKYLKNTYKIEYKMVMKRLEISKGVIQRLTK